VCILTHDFLLTSISSIAKYTEGYIHLERCSPSMPEPNPATPVHEQFKVLESPRSYYQNVADSITPARAPRLSNPRSANSNADGLSTSPPGLRKASTMYASNTASGHDPHISGHEPRAFPGIAFQRERRMSRRMSTSGSDGTAPDLSSGQSLEPGLAKFAVQEDARMEQLANED
jgi:hypothetical protein